MELVKSNYLNNIPVYVIMNHLFAENSLKSC
jgi:hypothetical protein